MLEAEQGGVRLTKTFTFRRGDYVIGVRHDVTNIGKEAMVALVWANEIFDHNRPDTVACPL